MRYRTHAGTGALFGLVADSALDLAGVPLEPAQAILLPVLSAYAAAWCDVDHHSAKIRWAAPWLRSAYVAVEVVVRLVWGERVARHWMGHRRITHSALFAVGSGLASWPMFAWVVPAVMGVVNHAIAGTSWQLLLIPLLPVWLMAGLLSTYPVLSAAAVTLGSLAHIAGDMCTPHGCPVGAPWSWRNRHLVLLCSTDSEQENSVDFWQAAGVFVMVFVAIKVGG